MRTRPPLRGSLWLCVSLCALLGIVHIAFTFFAFAQLTQRALYFAGTGLLAVMLALFNLATWRNSHTDRLSRQLTHIANALMTVFSIFAVLAVPEPQAYLGAVLFWTLFVVGALIDRAQASSFS